MKGRKMDSSKLVYIRFMNALRKILFPFALLYEGIIRLRNACFDRGILTTRSYDFPVICVGNLSVGGTGKTPMVEYLIRLFQPQYTVATLSRGYGRKTKGFYRLNGKESATQTGDEPLQFKMKFPEVLVTVGEDRQQGIAKIKAQQPHLDVVLLDDAYQHRKVTPGFSILLTAYGALYTADRMLPVGNLREPKSGAQRADVVVVTKCPSDISIVEQKHIQQELSLMPEQQLYFTKIGYADAVFNAEEECDLKELPTNFCLVTGIAKPEPLVHYLKNRQLTFRHRRFKDHHHFSAKEIAQLQKERCIITTEKDYMRLKSSIQSPSLYYLPIQQEFVGNKEGFDAKIKTWVERVLQREA